ncbi:jg11685 [Pararge aegeria aegeria]|uniref:Jg11685 protein n=1 Tax=Pararge aegeria aegeria TaxID=348720 RepID=A0A8S4S3B8_9NEOP|nr:jg11685 [Pararge aegeria aegeria]
MCIVLTRYLTSPENRHALPLFTSLLNTVCSYDPVGLGLPYNHLLFADTVEPLVEVALQVLIVTLDHDTSNAVNEDSDERLPDNLFINYLSRIHRDEDFQFALRGVTRLLNNPLQQTYLPNSSKKVALHQELLVLFWKCCDYNKKFMYYVLKSSDVLEVLVPILYHLNDSRADQSRVGLMHIGVFILLLLSGERNFGVRLNKPYTATVPMDIPVFTGTHADLLVVVFHKIITTGHQRLQPLFDCLLTILVNAFCLQIQTFTAYCFSLSVPEDPVHGVFDEATAPAGGVQHTLVPVLAAAPPPPRVLPAGDVQQHDTVSVRW